MYEKNPDNEKDSHKKNTTAEEIFFQKAGGLHGLFFGSYAKGQAFYDSDVDIAVYFKLKTRRLEWEETGEWPEETEIWADTEKILGKNVDILVLNKAP
ncbi:MAG: hypothetical protein DCC43_15555, partial [Candidatus Brocadia sp.]